MMTENEHSTGDTDREAWEHASRGDMAGKWHTWCADCGAKNHKNANECVVCGYGDVENGELFGVGNRRNVGRPKYTSDGEEGVYDRSLKAESDQ